MSAATVTTAHGTAPRIRAAVVGATTPRADDWPHTRRLLPWVLAGFLTVLWLVPFDAIDLPVNLPVDSKLDRILLVAVAALWLATDSRFRTRPRWLSTPAAAGIGLFTFCAVASVVLNLGELAWLDDLEIATKRIAHLLSFILFFAIIVTTVRPSEARGFLALFVGLAAIAAIGTVYEYRTAFNPFFDWTRDILPGSIDVDPPPPDPKFGRENVTGPTDHGLAIATMLSVALPFAITGVMSSRERRERLLFAVATTLIIAGSVATLRKTSFVAPAAGLLVLVAYRPRHMARLLPLGGVVALLVLALAPGAVVRVKAQFVANFSDRNTTVGRTSDYTAVEPDVNDKPVLGRGFGSYDPEKYRILDNEFLALLIETGAIGVLAYIAMMVTVIATAHPAIKRWDPVRGPPALAAAAGAVAYGVANLLFDAFAFPQVPYMFFFLAAMTVVCSTGMWPRHGGPATGARPPASRSTTAHPGRRRWTWRRRP